MVQAHFSAMADTCTGHKLHPRAMPEISAPSEQPTKQEGTTTPSDGQGVSTTPSQEQQSAPTTPSQGQRGSSVSSQGQSIPGTPSIEQEVPGTTSEQGSFGGTSETVSVKPFCHVVVCGSTYGDKRAGFFLAKVWLNDPSELVRKTFSGTPYLVNPRAAEKNTRYIDKDINSCFTDSILRSPDSKNDPYEVTRAKEINRVLGPKGSAKAYDLLLDMHTSTSNIGATFLIDNAEDHFAMHMARYAQKHFRLLKIYIFLHMRPKDTSANITSITRCGITLEVGPVATGTLRVDAYIYMKTLIDCCLDFTDQFNQGVKFPAFEVEAYQNSDIEAFPLGADGEFSAMIHPNLQDQDYLPVKPGDPIFQTFDGKDVLYNGDKTFYPVFVNDSGMYETKHAFVKTDKIKFRIPVIQASGKCGDVHAKGGSA